MDAAIAVRDRGTRILSLICSGHFVSHFYMMVLPPLFPFISGDLGLSYAELGFLLTARFVATGLAQVPAGFLVDRYGAKAVLVGGMVLMVLGYVLFVFGAGFWPLLLFVCMGGAGDSVFHPADYAILNGSVAQDRMGRAYSVHTFAGHIGFAVGPATMPFLAVHFGWRAAMLAAALFGFVILLAIVSQWGTMREDQAGKRPKKVDKDAATGRGLSILLSPPILLLFGFFTISTLASNGMTGFSVSALIKLQDIPEELAGTPLSAFMLTSAFAVLAGGIVADRKIRQDLFAAFGFFMAALIILLIAALPLPYLGLLAAFACAGFFLGVIRPARDLMVRDLAPPPRVGQGVRLRVLRPDRGWRDRAADLRLSRRPGEPGDGVLCLGRVPLFRHSHRPRRAQADYGLAHALVMLREGGASTRFHLREMKNKDNTWMACLRRP